MKSNHKSVSSPRSGGIPKLEVQPGTPLPSPRLGTLPAIIPTSSTTPSTHNNNITNRSLSSACSNASSRHTHISQLQGNPNLAMGRFTLPPPPAPAQQHGRQHQGSVSGRGGLSSHQLQAMAPTPAPSDVSSIQNTPRGGLSTPSLSMHSQSIDSSHMDKTDTFLMPGQVLKQESWSIYKVLPGVQTSVPMDTSSGHNHHHNPGSATRNTLSPFAMPDISPTGSLLVSPRNSARRSKKRALSTSTLSSDFDILSMIRSSPSALLPFLVGSGSQTSPGSPQPSQHGSLGHLQARDSSPRPSAQHRISDANLCQLDSSVVAAYFSMGLLEGGGGGGGGTTTNGHAGENAVVNQQVLGQQEDMFYAHQFYKQEPDTGEYNGLPMQGQMPPVSQQANLPADTAALEAPPPPYPYPAPSVPPPPLEPICDTEGVKNEEGGQFVCRWIDCHQMFGEQDELVRHLEKQHIDQRRGDDFTCFWQGCARRCRPFNARYKLLIHMRVHSGEKPNKCPFEGCNKAFSRLENLKIHLRSHTGERPYQCTYQGCIKAFSNSSDRAKHQRTHQDTKPYACTVPGCSKRYTDPSSLRKHGKSHTPQEQKARKKARTIDGEILDVLSVQSVRPNQPTEEQSQMQSMYQPGMRFGHAPVNPAPPMQPQLPANLQRVDFNHRVGGGFNPAPNGALILPARNTSTSHIHSPAAPSGPSVTKLPPPPPYPEQQQQQPQEQQQQQWPSPRPVPTPTPAEVEDAPVAPVAPPSYQHSPRPCALPDPSTSYQHLQVPRQPVSSSYQAPAAFLHDYMPCNLQERMTTTYHMPLSLEETLANLPYDAIQVQRALSNHSGGM